MYSKRYVPRCSGPTAPQAWPEVRLRRQNDQRQPLYGTTAGRQPDDDNAAAARAARCARRGARVRSPPPREKMRIAESSLPAPRVRLQAGSFARQARQQPTSRCRRINSFPALQPRIRSRSSSVDAFPAARLPEKPFLPSLSCT